MTAVRGRLFLAAMLGLGLAWAAGCGKKVEEGGKDAAVEKPAPPRIAAVQSSFDAGKVKQGENVEHVFKVRNEGKSELILEKAKSS
jgi:hypothetical protein